MVEKLTRTVLCISDSKINQIFFVANITVACRMCCFMYNENQILDVAGASGGLCEKWKEYNENNRRIYKSLNTGIVTLVNYGSRVPPKVSTLTFAHEVGHNFGSPVGSIPKAKYNKTRNVKRFALGWCGLALLIYTVNNEDMMS